jgi:hypothetical protein
VKFQIDIGHNPQVLAIITYHLQCWGWDIFENTQPPNPNWVAFPNKTARLFEISVEGKNFHWKGGEEFGDNELYDKVVTPEAAHALMEFIKDNVEVLKDVPLPKKKLWNTDGIKEWQQEVLAKFSDPAYKDSYITTAVQQSYKQPYKPMYFYDYVEKMENPYKNKKLEQEMAAIIHQKAKQIHAMTVKAGVSFKDWMDAQGNPPNPYEYEKP